MKGEVMDEGYNGWANWETWVVNLWLANDEGLYRSTLEAMKARRPDEAIQELVREMLDEPAGLKGDIIGRALSAVDWAEIARGFREDAE